MPPLSHTSLGSLNFNTDDIELRCGFGHFHAGQNAGNNLAGRGHLPHLAVLPHFCNAPSGRLTCDMPGQLQSGVYGTGALLQGVGVGNALHLEKRDAAAVGGDLDILQGQVDNDEGAKRLGHDVTEGTDTRCPTSPLLA